MTFGKWIEKTRKAAGLEQKEVAQRSGLSTAYISQLERHQPHLITNADPQPSRKSVLKIARALNVPAAEALEAAGWSPDENQSLSVEINIGNEVKAILLRGKKDFTPDEIEDYHNMMQTASEVALKLIKEKRK